MMRKLLPVLFLASVLTFPALAQEATPQPARTAPINASQEMCISVMTGFPNTKPSIRYQFLRLSKSLAKGADADFRQALAHYGSKNISDDTPVTDIIEGMANPVLRQAEPALVVGQGSYLINFAIECAPQIQGQISALHAYDPDLKQVKFNTVIDEDALFLRQVISDALYALNADKNPDYSAAVKAYAENLVRTRDDIEYTAFNGEVGDIEALYLGDLDKRLARSNDIVNAEADREVLSSSMALARDMSEHTIREEKRRSVQTLLNILNGYTYY